MDFNVFLSRVRDEMSSSYTKLIEDLANTPVELPMMRIDEVCDALCNAVVSTNGRQDSWHLLDRTLKFHSTGQQRGGGSSATAAAASASNDEGGSPFLEAMKIRIVPLAAEFAYKTMSVRDFKPFFDSFRILFGTTISTLMTLKLKAAEKALSGGVNVKQEGGGNQNTNLVGGFAAPDKIDFSNNNNNNNNQNNIINNNTSSASSNQNNNNSSSFSSSSSSSSALVVHKGVRSVGGFGVQQANNKREMGYAGALSVKTRDSRMAVTQAAMYAPAAPAEIALHSIPERDRNAPIGFMKAELANNREQTEQHLTQRKERLQHMFKRMRDKTEEESGSGDPIEESRRKPERGLLGASGADLEGEFITSEQRKQQQQIQQKGGSGSGGGELVDTFDDIRMPLEFPRDDFGVKIGYFPLGVRFLRDAIRSCGGAVELTVLEQRIGQMTDADDRGQFGDLRQFLFIHSPTFTVTVDEADEKGQKRLIVRLTEDVDRIKHDTTGSLSIEPSWVEMICPHCSRKLPGRNFARHEHCRRCIGVQISLGMKEKIQPESPIMNLTAAAIIVLRKVAQSQQLLKQKQQQLQQNQNRNNKNNEDENDNDGEDETCLLDDDDIDFFSNTLVASANIPRFRHASEKLFAPILKALRSLRDRFLKLHNAASFDAVKLLRETGEDAAYAKLFRVWGENMLRLPIPWIDLGDVIDMSRKFTANVKPPHLPTPKPGDPRIKVGNQYPGFILAESGTDVEDQTDDAEDELSDDEAPSFHFAPPVSVMETVMIAGSERDTKKLNHKLHTAPPILAQQVIQKTDGTSTLQQVANRFGNK